jgi:co-chaperonin GroES (HSP10)
MTADALQEAFPTANPGIQPFGSRILVQIRSPKTKTASGIIIDNGSRDTEKWNTQVAKVISVGALAFKNRNSMEPWPEGSWCVPGDYVRVAKYGGDRWEVPLPNGETALYVIFNDLDIIGRVEGDPLAIRAFI